MPSGGSIKDGERFKPSCKETDFAEKHEQARKREEKWSRRERQRRRFRHETSDQKMARFRIAELERLFTKRYGSTLPNDDAGRDDLEIILHHLARIHPSIDARSVRECGDTEIERMIEWAKGWAPWLPQEAARQLAAEIARSPKKFRADDLAQSLNLTMTERTLLNIRTIGAVDVTKKRRAEIAKRRRVEQKSAKRRAEGVRPRDEYESKSLTKMEPWKAQSISRTTWYNRRSKGHTRHHKRRAASDCIMQLLADGPTLSADLAKMVLKKTRVSEATRRRAWDDLRRAGKVEAYRPNPAGKGEWYSRRLDVMEQCLANAA